MADPASQLRRPSHLRSLDARLIAREPVPWRIPLSTKADMLLRPFSRVLSATALVLLASGAACKNDSGVTGPPTLEGQYKGTLAGEYAPTFSASLDLTVAASTTGTITPVGAAPITVTGTYVASTKAVAVSGGGFTIAGTIDNTGKLLGTYTHSSAEGRAVAYQHTTASPVTVFCGTYAGDADGIWNLVRRGTSLSGAYDNVDDMAAPPSAQCLARPCRARGREGRTWGPGPATRPADRLRSRCWWTSRGGRHHDP